MEIQSDRIESGLAFILLALKRQEGSYNILQERHEEDPKKPAYGHFHVGLLHCSRSESTHDQMSGNGSLVFLR